ncbi:DUF2059 domain-containing protein [Chromobacterium phragmitis]|uniref:DUF2059 domain-containing protein n=1 Tax=Chromobacterium phragmitis TaxID=2202141 RepID=A0ABV0IXN7_9NEIS
MMKRLRIVLAAMALSAGCAAWADESTGSTTVLAEVIRKAEVESPLFVFGTSRLQRGDEEMVKQCGGQKGFDKALSETRDYLVKTYEPVLSAEIAEKYVGRFDASEIESLRSLQNLPGVVSMRVHGRELFIQLSRDRFRWTDRQVPYYAALFKAEYKKRKLRWYASHAEAGAPMAAHRDAETSTRPMTGFDFSNGQEVVDVRRDIVDRVCILQQVGSGDYSEKSCALMRKMEPAIFSTIRADYNRQMLDVYRSFFSDEELKDIVTLYRSPAYQKLAQLMIEERVSILRLTFAELGKIQEDVDREIRQFCPRYEGSGS